MKTPSPLIEIATRHQVHVERLKSHDSKAFHAFLKAMDRDISRQLAGKELTDFTVTRLNRQIKAVRESLTGHWADYGKVWREQLQDLAEYEAGFESRALGQVVKYDFTLPSPRQLESAVFSRPLHVAGPDGGKLLEPFFRGWSDRMVGRVDGAIRLGYAQGQTTQQIIQTIRGTRAGRFQDGLLRNFNDSAEMLVRTGLQHSASVAREAVWEANSDLVKKVRWVSTLDARTTAVCQSLDGREFPIDEGPRPPIHIGCRSAVVGVLDEKYDFLDKGATRAARDADGNAVKAPAKETYFEWLKRQPAEFQDSAIGPTRGKLFRDGGLSAERFAELQLGKNFKPLPLYGRPGVQGMADLEPVAFARAGL